MMEALLAISGIHLLALASPGPDLLLVLRASLFVNSAKVVACCIGVAMGVATHLLFVYFGLSIVIQKSTVLYSLLVIAACLWLLDMGVSGLRNTGKSIDENMNKLMFPSLASAFCKGYFTNILNPKALVYFISIISPLFKYENNTLYFLITGITLTAITFFWFYSISLLLHKPNIKKIFNRYILWIDRLFSLCILLLAISIIYKEATSLLF